MRQAAKLNNLKLPLLVPGMSINPSPTDYFMFKQAQLQRFDGTQWRLFGELISTDAR